MISRLDAASVRKLRGAALLGCLTLVFTVLAAVPARALELTTYAYGNGRTGSAPGPAGISPGSATRLHIAWVASLAGAIDGQALVVNGVRARRGKRIDLVLVATEHGEIAALNLRDGGTVWKRWVGAHSISPSCQASPDGVFGVTGTMVVDQVAGRVYAVDVNGRAWALSLATGKPLKGWPVRVHLPGADFVWGGLALSKGWLYVPIASLCDRGRYYGGLKAVDTATPHRILQWQTTAHSGAYAGGIWAWAGESIDGRTGDVFVATGNAIGGASESAGNAEQVIRLSAELKLKAHNYPLTPPFAITDRDFGSTPVLFSATGCPSQLVATNKDGYLYRYNRYDISSGPRQSLQVAASTASSIPLLGMPAYDPGTRRMVLVSPTSTPGTLHAGIQSFVLGRRCNLVPSWQRGFDPPDAGSSPTIAGGVLFLGTGRNGVLRAYRLSDGQELWSQGVGATNFDTPSVADGTVLDGTWAGQVWAFKP